MKNFQPQNEMYSDVKNTENGFWQIPAAFFAGGYAPMELALFYPGGLVP